jgi:UDP-glucose 6-dehydrogenase
MKISIVGTGYVGLVTGTCFAETGLEVTCIDKDSEKINKLNNGIIPIYEPGLEKMVGRNIQKQTLSFSTDIRSSLPDSDVVFIAVGTPQEEDAVEYFLRPDRIVIGIDSERAEKIMKRLYHPFLLNNHPLIFMDIPSAELTKYAANSMLATKISFMNEIANLCELTGADVNMVRIGIGSDPRIGNKYIYAGAG